jgi:hypothetical protein
MSRMSGETIEWRIYVDRYGEDGLRFSWVDDYKLQARWLGDEVVIQGDAAGLETLARHLLALAQDGVPSGFHSHLESGIGLETGSCGLVLEREDDPAEYGP